MNVDSLPIAVLIFSAMGGFAGLAAFAKVMFDARANARKAATEERATNVDVAKEYEEMAGRQVQRIKVLKERVDALEMDCECKDKDIKGLTGRVVVLEHDLQAKNKTVGDLIARVESLEKDLESKDKYIEELLQGIRILLGQFQSIQVEPNWTPPSYQNGTSSKRGRV